MYRWNTGSNPGEGGTKKIISVTEGGGGVRKSPNLCDVISWRHQGCYVLMIYCVLINITFKIFLKRARC